MSLDAQDKEWLLYALESLESRLDEKLELLRPEFDQKFQALRSEFNQKLERVETNLLTAFHQWALLVDARVRSHG